MFWSPRNIEATSPSEGKLSPPSEGKLQLSSSRGCSDMVSSHNELPSYLTQRNMNNCIHLVLSKIFELKPRTQTPWVLLLNLTSAATSPSGAS
eukprot:337133-Pyramimonas_sp.AAC.1